MKADLLFTFVSAPLHPSLDLKALFNFVRARTWDTVVLRRQKINVDPNGKLSYS